MKLQYCFVQKKVVPQSEVIQGRYTQQGIKAADLFTSDEVPPTKSPISGKMYTSKSQLRAEYKAKGYEEIGNEYDNGYTPESEKTTSQKELAKNLQREIAEKMQVSSKTLNEYIERRYDEQRQSRNNKG